MMSKSFLKIIKHEATGLAVTKLGSRKHPDDTKKMRKQPRILDFWEEIGRTDLDETTN